MIRRGFGKLNKCVELHSKGGATTTQDEFGQPAEAYTKYADAFASLNPFSGREFMQAQQISAQSSGKAFMRYDSRIVPADRIIYKTRTLEINAVINIEEQSEYLEIWYSEIH